MAYSDNPQLWNFLSSSCRYFSGICQFYFLVKTATESVILRLNDIIIRHNALIYLFMYCLCGLHKVLSRTMARSNLSTRVERLSRGLVSHAYKHCRPIFKLYSRKAIPDPHKTLSISIIFPCGSKDVLF